MPIDVKLLNEQKTNEISNSKKWDLRFLDMAKLVSTWSKDPSTQFGAVITRDKRVVSVGYNGFPQGVHDDPERYADRELKYKMIVHCERNALLFAKEDLHGCTLYTWPFLSCSVCAGMVIQSGIKRCVAPAIPEDKKERWASELALSVQMFDEAGVATTVIYPDDYYPEKIVRLSDGSILSRNEDNTYSFEPTPYYPSSLYKYSRDVLLVNNKGSFRAL